jgi:hypothetical protein
VYEISNCAIEMPAVNGRDRFVHRHIPPMLVR